MKRRPGLAKPDRGAFALPAAQPRGGHIKITFKFSQTLEHTNYLTIAARIFWT